MPPRVLLVRHGQTEWSLSGRHTGRTDIPLTDEGERAARLLGERLKGTPWSGLPDAEVRTSPLSRASRTCALAGFGDRAREWDALMEWDYGAYEGRTTPDIDAERPGWSLWRDGVPEGETVAETAARADRVVAWIRECGRDVVLFSHGHLLRTLTVRWLGLDMSAGARFALAPASLSVLGWAHDEPALERWNDTAHLD